MALSNRQGPVRPAAAHLIDMALRRALLAAAGEPADLQGRIDCAELALALDLEDEARLLFEIAFIARGYDSHSLAAQEQLRRETSLWEPCPLRTGSSEGPATELQARIDGAVADLAACLTLPGQTIGLPNEGRPGTRQPVEDRDLPALAADLARHVHALHRALREPLSAASLAEAVHELATHPLICGSFTAREHVDAPIAILAGLLAAESMRHFLHQRHALFVGPLASPALIHKAAGFERSGLGPWFSHAIHLVRDERALIGLAAAPRAGGDTRDALERGLGLLSSGLAGTELAGFVDVVADEGFVQILELIAARYRTAATGADRPVLWRLRDAAVDLAAFDLAIEMQTILVALAPLSSVEARILAELEQAGVSQGYGSTAGSRDLRRAKRPVTDTALAAAEA